MPIDLQNSCLVEKKSLVLSDTLPSGLWWCYTSFSLAIGSFHCDKIVAEIPSAGRKVFVKYFYILVALCS